MREIKFRAWDTLEKKMVFGHFNLPPVDTITKTWLYMQYTGLHDKNGKEIYEGDILKYQSEICTVEWKLGAWLACCTKKDGLSGHWLGNNQEYIEEIIGNIYENPELLI